jgi:hypothetical protein
MVTKRKMQVLEVFSEVARPVIRQWYRVDSYIGSTRTTVDALKRFGIAARPVAVAMWAGNQEYLDCLA